MATTTAKREKKDPESYWNYRVLYYPHTCPVTGKDAPYLRICEIHYRQGIPTGYGEQPTAIDAHDLDIQGIPAAIKEIAWNLDKMKEALEKPILWAGEKFPQEYKPEE